MEKKTTLSDALAAFEKNPPKEERHLHSDSTTKLLTDEEMAEVLGKRAERLRFKQEKKQNDFDMPQSTYSKFAKSGQISLVGFIKVMRALGRYDELDALLKLTVAEEIASFKDNSKAARKRVR